MNYDPFIAACCSKVAMRGAVAIRFPVSQAVPVVDALKSLYSVLGQNHE